MNQKLVLNETFFLSFEFYLHTRTKLQTESGSVYLTKIRCGRENAKYFDGKRDSAAPLEAQFTKICVREAGFFAYLPGVRENISSIAANARSNSNCFSFPFRVNSSYRGSTVILAL